MSTHRICRYEKFDGFTFDELPKGEMFSIGMNPYTGAVFFGLEKHESSTQIALDIMREVVHACELLERLDCSDPLRDYIAFCESGEIVPMLCLAARAKITVLEGEKLIDSLVDDVRKIRKTA